MKKYILILLALIFMTTSVNAQVLIFNDCERSLRGVDEFTGFSTRQKSHFQFTQDSILLVMVNNDAGNDNRGFYSDDGGATWTLMDDGTMFNRGDADHYSISVGHNDTVYVAQSTINNVPILIRSWHNGTWYGIDTVGNSINYTAALSFTRWDTLCFFYKPTNHRFTVSTTLDGLDTSATWVGAADTVTTGHDYENAYIWTYTLDGLAIFWCDDNHGVDSLYFAGTDGFKGVAGGVLGGDYNASAYGAGAFVSIACRRSSDTLAFAVHDFDSIYVKVGRFYNNGGTMTWSDIRNVTVSTGGLPTFVNNDVNTWAFPAIQWDANGALRVYYKYYADTSAHAASAIHLKESTDYGTTFGDAVELLAATTTDTITAIQVPPVSSTINGSQILRGVAYSDDASYGPGQNVIYFIADSTALLTMGGAEAGPPYFPGVK